MGCGASVELKFDGYICTKISAKTNVTSVAVYRALFVYRVWANVFFRDILNIIFLPLPYMPAIKRSNKERGAILFDSITGILTVK